MRVALLAVIHSTRTVYILDQCVRCGPGAPISASPARVLLPVYLLDVPDAGPARHAPNVAHGANMRKTRRSAVNCTTLAPDETGSRSISALALRVHKVSGSLVPSPSHTRQSPHWYISVMQRGTFPAGGMGGKRFLKLLLKKGF